MHSAEPAFLTRIHTPAAAQPVTLGVPMPRGLVHEPAQLQLRSSTQGILPLQGAVLDRWADGSVRWVLLDFHNDPQHAPLSLHFEADADATAPAPAPAQPVKAHQASDGSVSVDTGSLQFTWKLNAGLPCSQATFAGTPLFSAAQTLLRVQLADGSVHHASWHKLSVEHHGPLRACIRGRGSLQPTNPAEASTPLELDAEIHAYAGSAALSMSFTLRNPQPAKHPNGCWPLGQPSSVMLKQVSLHFAGASQGVQEITLWREPGLKPVLARQSLTLHQESSGGEHWNSPVHRNREHKVPLKFRGYECTSDGQKLTGLRATPVIKLRSGDQSLSLAVPHFWQNFPQAIHADSAGLVLALLPAEHGDLHELQGGEQKTWNLWLGAGSSSDVSWTLKHQPSHAEPRWYAHCQAMPMLTPEADDPHSDYLALVHAAIEGEHSFKQKAERIDEFGWRNFGDLYADHEAVGYKGAEPLVSHYNNQYDPVASFALHFMRSGDSRWHELCCNLAQHVIDIDLYHTDGDKNAYNRGLFWHTYHYVDADTSTHRSYPALPQVSGGGPAAGHLYATGLMLHHYLTGSLASREAAISLGGYVLDADDGTKTPILRWLSHHPTGHISSSGFDGYQGPGRSPGNSLSTLLDIHRLTGDPKYLHKAHELIRRCIHPHDDLAQRKLSDVENRWFYTIFLQALAKFLDHKAELGQVDDMYAYAQASLLHYARWAAEHEYPYLQKPEILEYPNETWAAQDIRKAEVFRAAARHATDPRERQRFLERMDFFFNVSVSQLKAMPTRSLCRPLALLLAYGYAQAHVKQHGAEPAPQPAGKHAFPPPVKFASQKDVAKKRVKLLAAAGGAVMLALLAVVAQALLR